MRGMQSNCTCVNKARRALSTAPAACRHCCSRPGPWRTRTCSPAWGRRRRGSLQARQQCREWVGPGDERPSGRSGRLPSVVWPRTGLPKAFTHRKQAGWVVRNASPIGRSSTIVIHPTPPYATYCSLCRQPQQRSPAAALPRPAPPAWSAACLQKACAEGLHMHLGRLGNRLQDRQCPGASWAVADGGGHHCRGASARVEMALSARSGVAGPQTECAKRLVRAAMAMGLRLLATGEAEGPITSSNRSSPALGRSNGGRGPVHEQGPAASGGRGVPSRVPKTAGNSCNELRRQ